ncbi:hypothetical protein MMC08_000590 [Hypocenomyce scalaris]|nr:hypothetical protein [Hypocenomyce scalaris]
MSAGLVFPPKQNDGPIHAGRPLRVIIAGGGASGLLMAYKLQRNFDNLEFVIYEKNPDIGGTWYENRYPGCACDNPAHTYVWSFDPNPAWTSTYATSKDIHTYFKGFQSRYSLGGQTRTSHRVASATWSEEKGRWDVTVEDTVTKHIIHDSCQVFINAGGILNNWRWPAIPGIKDFKGPLVHSAAWPENLDLKDKHVGLIGNGSSGIQILPAILPAVSKVTTFIREPTWVAVAGFAGFAARNYTDEERSRFLEDPNELTKFRKWLEHNANKTFPLFLDHSDAQTQMKAYFEMTMKEKIQDQALEDKLIPKWGVGCRRLTPGVGYLESLRDAKTEVVYGEIEKVNETGLKVDNGKEYPVDVLTGFDTTFKPRFPVKGPHGRLLSDDWEKEPRSYLGLAAADYPNYFMFLGPNSPVGNGPVLIAQADYMCKIIKRIQLENIKSVQVKMEAVDDFITYKDKFMKSTVWEQDCRSWYKGNTIGNKVTALWAGSTLHYKECLEEVRYEDYNVKCWGNRFDYFGNGLSRIETFPDADLAYYVRPSDDGPNIGSKFVYEKASLELQGAGGAVVAEKPKETRGEKNKERAHL